MSGSLVLQAVQAQLFPYAKTANVTRQWGQSGSASLWAPDRPAELHDGWAVSISRFHLWPLLDYSWRLFYSLRSSAPLGPLTSHSAGRLQELSHHTSKWRGKELRLVVKWGEEDLQKTFLHLLRNFISTEALLLSKDRRGFIWLL